MTNQLYNIFRKNFPYIVRQDSKVKEILQNKDNKIITKIDKDNNLIAVSVINGDTILMLCVDKEYRRQGIGSQLLKQSEQYIANQGHTQVKVGVGFDYLMPGVPTGTKVCEQELENAQIYDNVDDSGYKFFVKHGYEHSWQDCNCFDMRLDLKDFNQNAHSIGDSIDGITYTWATLQDLSQIVECTDDAHQEFTKYYLDQQLYTPHNDKRVLIAKDGEQVVGTLIVSLQTEAVGLGSVGCTTVRHSHRGRHIAVNMVILGTKYLKDIGLPQAYLGYTYTGLDHMYGYAGYKICVYYFMAQKALNK